MFLSVSCMCLFSLASCSSELIVPKYSSAESTPFVIGILALGVLTGLMFYNFFLAVSTKERMFIYFSVMMVLLGILQTFSTYDRFFFQLTYNRVTLLTHTLFITFLLFFEDFYQTARHHAALSRWNRMSIAVIAGYTILFFLLKAVFPHAPSLHELLNFIRELFVFYTNILFIANSILAMRWIKTEALLILIAFIPPALLTSLNAMNIFPFMSRFDRFVMIMMQYNQPVGLSVQAILLSLALGNKYNRINAEKEQAENERRQLQQLDADKTEFFMNISHELRTPLTIILGMTEQLKNGRFGDSVRRSSSILDAVERNGLRLLKQINSMLRIGRPDSAAGSRPGSGSGTAKIAVQKQLQLFVDELSAAAHGRHIQLNLEQPSGTDADQLETACLDMVPEDFDSAVLNLISNALKFTPEGGRVTLNSRIMETGDLHISVEDTGPGIPNDQQEAVFRRYIRLNETGTAGTGLGLPLVKSIMDGLGGSAAVSSIPGKGSCFSLAFPAEIVSSGTIVHLSDEKRDPISRSEVSMYAAELSSSGIGIAEIRQEAHRDQDKKAGIRSSMHLQNPQSDAGGNHPPLLLIVEDNRDMLDYLAAVLSPEFQLITAENGQTALSVLETEQPDLIISDIMMPEMNGHAFFLEYRRRYPSSTVPFMFLTARDALEEKLQSIENGAVQYITKPFYPRELLASIRSILNREQMLTRAHVSQIRRGFDQLLEKLEHPGHLDGAQSTLSMSIETVRKQHQLSNRETEVFRLLIRGKSDKEIATVLDISPSTVANHNRQLYRKLGVNSRTGVISKYSRINEN